MTIRVSVFSAANLSRSASDPDICPTVAVWAYGPGRFRLGETPESLFRHPQTANPLWQVSLDVDWFRVSQLEFVISHFRPVIPNKKVARIRVPIAQIPLGAPFTVPVTYNKPGQPSAQFTFQIDRSPSTPFTPISQKWAHKRLYVYATYDPPLPPTPGPLPVTFSVVHVHDMEQRFSVFDEFVHWQSMGKGSHGFVSLGPTGPTHVVHLNRPKCDKTTSGFLVTSQSYTGSVTLNFLLAESAKGFSPGHSLPRNESRGLLLQSSVAVAPGAFACLAHAIRITGHDYTVRQIEPAALPPGGDAAGFVRHVVNTICPDIVVRQRNLLPARFPSSLTAAAGVLGLPAPHRIGIVGSFVPIVVSNGQSSTTYYATVSLLAFDAAGRFVGIDQKQSASFSALFSSAVEFNGAVATVMGAKYQPKMGVLRSPYYGDNQTFDVNLDALLAQGIWSLAVAMIPHPGWPLARFRRKAIRIVDADTKIEIALAHLSAPWVGKKWGMLAGGLVFANDGWSWLPGGDLVANANVPDFQGCWYQRLLQAQCLIPQ
jgi:hypothetical protein